MSNDPRQHAAVGNLLLAQLPVHERNAIQRGSEGRSYAAGEVLLHANSQSEFVYFPVDLVVSMVRTLRDGTATGLGMVGNEGMIGLDVFMDAKTQLDSAVVQSSGCAYRMPADDLLKQFRRGGELQRHLLRFTNAFLAQVAQNAVCARFHSVDARLARWLLMIHDRSSSAEVHATPLSIADTLGEDEGRLNGALEALAAGRAIRRRRHSITIVDREMLELCTCECYETLREEYVRKWAS